jgi:hypothetical protein
MAKDSGMPTLDLKADNISEVENTVLPDNSTPENGTFSATV